MFKYRTSPALALATMLAVTAVTGTAGNRLQTVAPAQAQSAPSFTVPESVPQGTALKVSSGSDSMTVLSNSLKNGFEGQFSGSEVAVSTMGADAALQALLTDQSDLAAISRPLTAAEKEQGLVAVPVQRIKIAVVVGSENPFNGGLNGNQFAAIFTGKITDWSEVGGAAGPIRLIDRPETSDTRLALAPYPVFQAAPFQTGSNATQLSEDSNEALVNALGKDGIGYILVTGTEGVTGIRSLDLHQTPPTDPRYPFSQPFSYVYKGEASPAVAAFLGYAMGETGQAEIAKIDLANPSAALANTVGDAAGNTVAAAGDAAGNATGNATDAAGNVINAAGDAAGNVVEAAGDVAGAAGDAAGDVLNAAGEAAGNATDAVENAVGNGSDATGNGGDAAGEANGSNTVGEANGNGTAGAQWRNNWWWLLLPVAALGLLLWAGKRGKKTNAATGSDTKVATTDSADSLEGNTENSIDGTTPNVGVEGVGAGGSNRNLPGIGTAVAGGAAVAGGVGAAAWGAIKKTQATTGDLAQGTLDQADNIIGDTSNAIGNATNTGQDLTSKGLEGVSGNLKGTIKKGQDFAQNLATGTTDSAKGMIGGLNDQATGFVKGGADQVGSLTDGVKGRLYGMPEDAIGTVKGGLDSVKGTVKDTAQGGFDVAKGGLGAIKDTAQGGFDVAKSTAQGGIDGTQSGLGAIKNTVQDGIEGTQDGLGAIKNTTQGGVEAAKGTFESGLGTGLGAIGNLGQQAKDGIGGMTDRVMGAPSDLANQAKQQATNLKDMANQSKDQVTDLLGNATDHAAEVTENVIDATEGNL